MNYFVYHVAKVLFIPLDLMVSVSVTISLVIYHIKSIIKSSKVVLCCEGGYGHTISIPDIGRRIDKDALIVFVSEYGRHNWKQSLIWDDVNVIHLLKSVYSHYYITHLIMCIFIKFILTKLFNKKLILTENKIHKNETTFFYEYMMLFVQKGSGCVVQANNIPECNEWMVYWYRLRRMVKRDSPTVPKEIKVRFYEALSDKREEKIDKLVTIYLRNKNTRSETCIRSGSELSAYRSAIHYLDKHGYTILIVGDRSSEEYPEDLTKYLFDANKINFNQEWFNILAISECERFIGESGGGSYLPCVFEKPILMCNVLPYFQGVPFSLMMFKRIVDRNNKMVNLDECLNDPWQTINTQEYKVLNNTEEMILGAVIEFVSVPLEKWNEYIKPQPIFPCGGWAVEAPARLVKYQDI